MTFTQLHPLPMGVVNFFGIWGQWMKKMCNKDFAPCFSLTINLYVKIKVTAQYSTQVHSMGEIWSLTKLSGGKMSSPQ